MVTKNHCIRLEKTLMKNADPKFEVTSSLPSKRGCSIDFHNTKVSDQLTSDELQDSYAHIGSIGYSEDVGYESEYGHKFMMLEGDVPVLGWTHKEDRRLTGTKIDTDQRVVDRLTKCGCEVGRKHEHYPAIHVHFKCVRDQAIICAMEQALEES